MATDPGTIEFLLDQLGPRAPRYATRRMFGEYCLYREGRPIALVCDDTLFVKDTAEGRAAIAEAMAVELGPPYPGAKPHLRIGQDTWDDGDWLVDVLERTAAALPLPKPKAPGKKTKPAAKTKSGGASAKKARPSKSTSKTKPTP